MSKKKSKHTCLLQMHLLICWVNAAKELRRRQTAGYSETRLMVPLASISCNSARSRFS